METRARSSITFAACASIALALVLWGGALSDSVGERIAAIEARVTATQVVLAKVPGEIRAGIADVNPMMGMPVVKVRVEAGFAIGHGSAVHIGDGVFVTAAHVVHGAEKISAECGGGWFSGEFLCGDEEVDIAFFACPELRHNPVANFAERMPSWGERVVVVGFPISVGLAATVGTFIGDSVMRDFGAALSCPAAPGNSGGAVYNGLGQLVGILRGGMLEYPQLSAMVPSAAVLDMLGVARETWERSERRRGA